MDPELLCKLDDQMMWVPHEPQITWKSSLGYYFFLRAIQVSPGILDGTVMIRSELVINMAGFQDQADMPVLKGMDWNAQKEK